MNAVRTALKSFPCTSTIQCNVCRTYWDLGKAIEQVIRRHPCLIVAYILYSEDVQICRAYYMGECYKETPAGPDPSTSDDTPHTAL